MRGSGMDLSCSIHVRFGVRYDTHGSTLSEVLALGERLAIIPSPCGKIRIHISPDVTSIHG
jgi:hypothetical protein